MNETNKITRYIFIIISIIILAIPLFSMLFAHYGYETGEVILIVPFLILFSFTAVCSKLYNINPWFIIVIQWVPLIILLIILLAFPKLWNSLKVRIITIIYFIIFIIVTFFSSRFIIENFGMFK